jgi:hypothetical protein
MNAFTPHEVSGLDARIYALAGRRCPGEDRASVPRGGQSDFGDDQLLEKLRDRMKAGPSHFHVLVPATPVDHAPFEPRVLAQAAFEVAA